MNEPHETPPGQARLRAKSKRQAMDWALVLASQGIAPVIHQDPEGKWQLLIPVAVESQAATIIRQYRIENRHWHWRHRVFKQRVMFDGAAGLWVLLVAGFYWLSTRHPELREAGMMNSQAVRTGEWWRLATATWLHADVAHLAGNAGFGFLLLALAMGRHGTGVGLLAASLAGAAGNLISLWVHGHIHQGLGASGVVMGALGLLATPARGTPGRKGIARRFVFTSLAGGFLLFALLGLAPNSDVAAHCGGFAAGLLLGWLLGRVPDLATNVALNVAAATGFAALVLVTWARAFRG